MKTIRSVCLLAAALLPCLIAGRGATAQVGDFRILGLSGNGELTFPVVPGYTNYTVEWAPTALGPWTNSWEQLKKIAPPGTNHTVRVPMFFRVLALGTRVQPPAGMAYVAPGGFSMGDNFATAGDALPVRPVTVGAFFIDRHEVSLSLWNEVHPWAVSHGYDFDNPGQAAATNQPVSRIDWYDAVKWCNARSEKEGIAPVYFTDNSQAVVYRTGRLDLAAGSVDWSGAGYRLPTEAEWEKAARGTLAGQHYPWPSGESDWSTQIEGGQANFWSSGDPFDNGATPVGFYDGHQSVTGQDMANGFGLYDMAGNLDEMCWDWYGTYAPGTQTDPRGPDQGDRRVRRGGSWYNGPYELRCPARRPIPPGTAGAQSGFRCVQSAVP